MSQPKDMNNCIAVDAAIVESQFRSKLSALKSSISGVEADLKSSGLYKSSGPGAEALRDTATRLENLAKEASMLVDRTSSMVATAIRLYYEADHAAARQFGDN